MKAILIMGVLSLFLTSCATQSTKTNQEEKSAKNTTNKTDRWSFYEGGRF